MNIKKVLKPNFLTAILASHVIPFSNEVLVRPVQSKVDGNLDREEQKKTYVTFENLDKASRPVIMLAGPQPANKVGGY